MYQQLIVKAYCVFLVIFHFYMILYDICILLHHIYKKNNTGTAQVGHVTNILQKEMISGIPDQVILYNSLSMFPQSYRHYPTYSIRAVVTSIIHREVLLYLIMY